MRVVLLISGSRRNGSAGTPDDPVRDPRFTAAAAVDSRHALLAHPGGAS